jgi:hypothetical protein
MNNKRILASVAVCANPAGASIEFCATRELREWFKRFLRDGDIRVVDLIVPETGLTCIGAQADDAKQPDSVTARSWQSKTDAPWRATFKGKNFGYPTSR